MSAPRPIVIEPFKDRAGKWRFRLRWGNRLKVLVSEAYSSASSCDRATMRLLIRILNDPRAFVTRKTTSEVGR